MKTLAIAVLVSLIPVAVHADPKAEQIAKEIGTKHAALDTVSFVRESTTEFPSRDREHVLIESTMTSDGKVHSVARQKVDGRVVGASVVFRCDGERFETRIMGAVPKGGCRGFGWTPERYTSCMLGGMFTSKIWKDGRYFRNLIEDVSSGRYMGEKDVTLPDGVIRKCDVVEVLRMNGDEVRGKLYYFIGTKDRLLWRFRVERIASGVISTDTYLSWSENPPVDPSLFTIAGSATPSRGGKRIVRNDSSVPHPSLCAGWGTQQHPI